MWAAAGRANPGVMPDIMSQSSYDVIVIGAGPVGHAVAGQAHAAGLSVVVIERELAGGECSYWP